LSRAQFLLAAGGGHSLLRRRRCVLPPPESTSPTASSCTHATIHLLACVGADVRVGGMFVLSVHCSTRSAWKLRASSSGLVRPHQDCEDHSRRAAHHHTSSPALRHSLEPRLVAGLLSLGQAIANRSPHPASAANRLCSTRRGARQGGLHSSWRRTGWRGPLHWPARARGWAPSPRLRLPAARHLALQTLLPRQSPKV